MMVAIANRRARTWLAVLLASTGLGLVSSPAGAAPVSIELCAVPGTITPTGSVSVPVWGFGAPTTPGDCTTATASLPGPMIDVNVGDTVTITVANALPAAVAPVHSLSLEIPGIVFDGASTPNADVGQTASVSFTAGDPGTYLYQSAGDGGRQEAMGLYGALIVRSSTVGQAYEDPATAYDVEATLVLSQVDPAFNAAPDTYDMRAYVATYWMINGKAYPDTAPIVAPAGSRTLLRYLNAGYDNTTMSLLGMHETVLARDAHLLNNPFAAVAETVPAGATEDAIATVPGFAPPSASGFALYNRQLHLTNGSQTGPSPDPMGGGGMLTFIRP